MTTKLLFVAGALLASAPAWAQLAPAAEQSSNDLVCQLSGDCGGMDQLDATQDKPESRGFKIARKVTASDAKPAAVPSIKARTVKLAGEVQSAKPVADRPGRSRTITVTGTASPVGRATLRVTFVTGSAELTDGGRREAEKFIAALTSPSLAGKKFRIEGHTDSLGSRESNIDLSKRRGLAVVEYLAANGADPARFEVVGYGSERPLAGLSASASFNRRVEIVLIP